MPRGEPGVLLLITEVAPYQQGAAPIPAGVHHSLPSAIVAMGELAELCELPYEHCSSVRSLADNVLETARILVLLTIGETPWSAQQRETIVERVGQGSMGLLGLHCATDEVLAGLSTAGCSARALPVTPLPPSYPSP